MAASPTSDTQTRAWSPLPRPSCHSRDLGQWGCQPPGSFCCPGPAYPSLSHPLWASTASGNIWGTEEDKQNQPEMSINASTGPATVTSGRPASPGCLRPQGAATRHAGGQLGPCPLHVPADPALALLSTLPAETPGGRSVQLVTETKHTTSAAQPGTAVSIVPTMTHVT